jgi:hypothetical protein
MISTPTVFQDSVNKLNEAIQVYTAAIGDLELKLSIAIFKQAQIMSEEMKYRFDSIEPTIQTLAGPYLHQLININ